MAMLAKCPLVNFLLNNPLKTHQFFADFQTTVAPLQAEMSGLEMEKEFFLDKDDLS